MISLILLFIITIVYNGFVIYKFKKIPIWKDIIAAMIGCATVFVAVAFGVLIAI
jgi:hypothetical protein